MSKKDKKIEIQLKDAELKVNGTFFSGYELVLGKKIIGQIAEIEDKFAVIKSEEVLAFHKKLENAIENVIENYNLNN